MKPNKILDIFYKHDIRFFSGVPDSCLSSLSNLLLKTKKKISHVMAPNEGVAVSLGVGYHLNTNKVPCIYMQNSGFGNATDPITNLCHKTVYNIPLILLIGWRGKPGIKDEPQHETQGKSIRTTLKSYGIKYHDMNNLSEKKISNIIRETKSKNQINALLIDKDFFEKKIKTIKRTKNKIYRSDAIKSLIKYLPSNYKIISSTGFNSRELLKQRKTKNKTFYMIGAMGHTMGVCIGMLNRNNKKSVVCVDGDGSFYMHLGSFSLLQKKHKLIYYLLDNKAHESVGEVRLNYTMNNIESFAKAVGFKKYIQISNLNNLDTTLKKIQKLSLPLFVHVTTHIEQNRNLPRPKDLKKIKEEFIEKK
jgi:phosphonopyruvate decarboxylase